MGSPLRALAVSQTMSIGLLEEPRSARERAKLSWRAVIAGAVALASAHAVIFIGVYGAWALVIVMAVVWFVVLLGGVSMLPMALSPRLRARVAVPAAFVLVWPVMTPIGLMALPLGGLVGWFYWSQRGA